MNQDEFHVFTSFLRKNYPLAYSESMAHLEGYREFMKTQVTRWTELQNQNPELNMPDSIERLLSQKAREPLSSPFFDSDKIYETPPSKQYQFPKKTLFR